MSARKWFRKGFIGGLGWAFGVTVGFTIVSTIFLFILSRLDTLPIIGGFVAKVVDSTLKALGK